MGTTLRTKHPAKSEILYGFHPVAEAVAAGRRKILEVRISRNADRGRMAPLTAALSSAGIPVQSVSDRSLTALIETHRHQGIAARVSPFPLTPRSELFSWAQSVRKPQFFLMLDRVVDPHNLGALLRSAEGAGAGAVILSRDRSASPTPTVSKASAGAMEHLRIAVVTNLVDTMRYLKESGYWFFGLDSEGGTSIFETALTGRAVLVVGGEEKGLRRLVRTQCDVLISIPQRGMVSSLNASVAGAVAMYERCRQQSRMDSTPV